MDLLNAMKIFVQVVESGSLSAAAGVLDMSTQNVAKTISTLESVNYLGGDACGFAHTSGYVVGRVLTGQTVSL